MEADAFKHTQITVYLVGLALTSVIFYDSATVRVDRFENGARAPERGNIPGPRTHIHVLSLCSRSPLDMLSPATSGGCMARFK